MDSLFSKDDKTEELLREWGHRGVVLYVYLLGEIASRYQGDPSKVIKFTSNSLRIRTKFYSKSYRNCLQFISKLFEFELKFHENPDLVEIHYPKFLEKQQKYFRSDSGRFDKVPPHTDKEEEEEIEEEGEEDNKKSCDHEMILIKWNKFASQNNLSTIQKISNPRKRKLYIRLKEKEFDLDRILNEAKSQPFLLGSKGWKMSFDWIIDNEKNYLKILEGNYKENGGKDGKTPSYLRGLLEYRESRQTKDAERGSIPSGDGSSIVKLCKPTDGSDKI